MSRKAFLARVRLLLGYVTFPTLSYEAMVEGECVFLRVACYAGTDNVTGKPCTWFGRKWRLSEHMTDGEIVQTAFLATLTALEHEVRETFLFQGVSVFDPHYDIHKLVELRKRKDALKEREG